MKITHRLAQRGWIETIRGKNGGMRLALPPHEINLGAVVRDTENDLALVDCFVAGNACTLSGHCGLTAIIDGALQQFMQHLDRFTLADILPESDRDSISTMRFIERVESNTGKQAGAPANYWDGTTIKEVGRTP